MKNLNPIHIHFFLILVCIITLSACRTESLAVSDTTTRARHYRDESSGVPCGGDPTDLRHWVREFRHSDENIVLAGFQTRWTPGGDPFPCNRLHRFVGQGVFRFDLTEIASRLTFRAYESAYIVITNYTPENGQVRIIQDNTWGAGNEFTSVGSVSGTDRYEVKRVIEAWDPAIETWGSEPVRSADLGNNDTYNKFEVPFRAGGANVSGNSEGILAVRINVTEIVRNILANGGRYGGNGVFGFSIEPVGPGLNYNRSNRSTGLFTVQLNITYRR